MVVTQQAATAAVADLVEAVGHGLVSGQVQIGGVMEKEDDVRPLLLEAIEQGGLVGGE
jgi:hypothetical protein